MGSIAFFLEMRIPMVLMRTNEKRARSSPLSAHPMIAYLGGAGIATVLKDRFEREFPISTLALRKTIFQPRPRVKSQIALATVGCAK